MSRPQVRDDAADRGTHRLSSAPAPQTPAAAHYGPSADGSARMDRVGDTVWLGGEIDLHNLEWLDEMLAVVLADGVARLDLSQLQFCSAAGLRALLRAGTPASPGDPVPARLALDNADSSTKRLLDLVTALDTGPAPAGEPEEAPARER